MEKKEKKQEKEEDSRRKGGRRRGRKKKKKRKKNSRAPLFEHSSRERAKVFRKGRGFWKSAGKGSGKVLESQEKGNHIK